MFIFQFQEVYEGHSEAGAYAAGFPEYQRTSSYDYSGQPIPPRAGFYEAECSGKKCQKNKILPAYEVFDVGNIRFNTFQRKQQQRLIYWKLFLLIQMHKVPKTKMN